VCRGLDCWFWRARGLKFPQSRLLP
jgi:hypothetical protein